MIKDSSTYEIMTPESVGAVNRRRRITSRIRLTSDEARLLSLSLAPISLA